MKALAAALLLAVAGCGGLPAVEACYDHPKYGKVCFKIGGRIAYDEKLTPAERAEVQSWLEKKERGE